MRSLGKLIARGGTAEIYAWQKGQTHCIKLFRESFPASEVEQEAKMARLIHQAGLPAPAVGEVVEINGRLGVVYERVQGYSMVEGWKAEPWKLFHFARFLAELQANIHSYQVAGLPSQRQRLKDKIETVFPRTWRKKTLKALTILPDGRQLCHGDFHPNNILITERGPIIVDWGNATQGNPAADFAKTSLLLTLGTVPPGTINRRLLTLVRACFHWSYVKQYQKAQSCDQKQFKAWRAVIAVAIASLNSNSANVEDGLLARVEAAFRIPQDSK